MRYIAIGLFVLASLSACNTVRGVGEDIQQGGKVIEKGAKEVQSGY